MTSPDSRNRRQDELVEKKQKGKKKGYQTPQIIYRAPLEAMAATCLSAPGKTVGLACPIISS